MSARTIGGSVDGIYSRQLLAFGEAGQKAIAGTHAAIVGVGGLGSHVAQQLGYLGVGRMTLIDGDRVEDTNMNRLVGAGTSDLGTPKVDVVAAAVRRVNERAKIEAIAADLRSQRALKSLQDIEVVFGCVDNDGARLILMELCCAYRKLYIDSATEIIPAESDRPFDFGGRVVVSIPGQFCLSCSGELDMEVAKADLEPEDVTQVRKAHGYGISERGPAPAVVSLNGIVASIAVTEFMVAVTKIRAAHRKSTYRGMRGVVQVSTDERRPDCINCGYLLGRGDSANVVRYARD
jgi:molybdopterin/thiamine biosynthesis adenylyltransferase